MIGEGVMQRAYRLCGVAPAPPGKVKAVPVVDQHPQWETIARAPNALSCRRILTVCRRIPTFCHVAHDGRGGFSRFGECDCRTRAERHAPLVPMQRILTKIRPAAARRHPHGEATLRIVENEPILAPVLGRQLLNLPLCQLHDSPTSFRSAAGPRTPSGPGRRRPRTWLGVLSQRVLQELPIC